MKTLADRPERAARLVQARLARGFKTSKAAAEKFGWPPASYNQHETGRTGYQNKLDEYAKAFKVSKAWLWTGEGPAPGERPALSIPEDIKQKLMLLDQDATDEAFQLFRSIVDIKVNNSKE